MNAKSVAPAAAPSVKIALGETLFPTITVVADRHLRADQEWFEGDGRGYTREFIPTEGVRYCEACHTTHDLKAFPTFSVPRANGETRGRVCRKARNAARTAAKVVGPTVEEHAEAIRINRAKKAAAASAIVRAAKAAARKAGRLVPL